MGIESAVARAQSDDLKLLPPVKEVEVTPLSVLPWGCSDRVISSWKVTRTVVLLSSFGCKFGELVRISFPGRLQWAGTHCLSVLHDLRKASAGQGSFLLLLWLPGLTMCQTDKRCSLLESLTVEFLPEVP